MANRNKKLANKTGAISLADLTKVVTKIVGVSERRLAGSVNRSFAHVTGQIQAVEIHLQATDVKILGLGNRIDDLVETRPSREEFGRLEGRVAVLETRRRR